MQPVLSVADAGNAAEVARDEEQLNLFQKMTPQAIWDKFRRTVQ